MRAAVWLRVSPRGSVSRSRPTPLVHANTAETPRPARVPDLNGHFSNESGHSDSRWHPAGGAKKILCEPKHSLVYRKPHGFARWAHLTSWWVLVESLSRTDR